MSGFLKRDTKTVNPAGGVNPAQAPNVGQFGWTSFDANNVNQIIEYVNLCKEYAARAKDSADYVELRFSELQEFMNFIEIVYSELKPIIDQIQPIYQDIIVRHEDVITRHIDVIRLHNEVTSDKVEINQIKADAITETLKVKADAISETNAIKAATITEATAIKNSAIADITVIKGQATGEANRAKSEADRAAAEAVKSANSATASSTSATNSSSEAAKAAASAKDAADIAEELRKGQVYRGTWNIESNKAYPPKPDTNSVWDVTLNEGSTEYQFDGKRWFWGDRLLYIKDDNKFSQIESGSGVLSVNGKSGAVTLDATDVGAAPQFIPRRPGSSPIYVRLATLHTTDSDCSFLLAGAGDHGQVHRTSIIVNAATRVNIVGINAKRTYSAVYGQPVRLYYRAEGGVVEIWMKTPSYQTQWGLTVLQKHSNATFTNDQPSTTEPSGLTEVTIETLYSTDFKPTAADVGAIAVGSSASSVNAVSRVGDTMTGLLRVNSGSSATPGLKVGSLAHKAAIGVSSASTSALFGCAKTDGALTSYMRIGEGEITYTPIDGGAAHKIYHAGDKPKLADLGTIVDLGGIRKSGDSEVGSLTLAADKVLNATITHQKGYMSIYPFSTGYGLGGASGNRARMYYKEHNNGNPSDISRGLVINSNDADGTSHPMNIWLGGQRVYHEGFKPTPASLGAVNKAGDTMTGVLNMATNYAGLGVGSLDMKNSNIIGVNAITFNDPSDVTNEAILFPKTGKTGTSTVLADYDSLRALDGSLLFNSGKVYHEGFKPTISDVIGADNSTNKRYTFNKPNGAVDGKFYPILLNGTNAYPDVFIQTASSGASSSMNHCAFRGIVRSGGWSDRGRAVSGEFIQYDVNERAIHSLVGSTESDNHYVIYVEARAFPLSVYTDSSVSVSSTGQNVVFGTTTYLAGIDGMTASGDFGTKTHLLMSFDKGNGNYGYNIKANYLSLRDGVNAGQRVFVENWNESGAFITRRPGKSLYSMMGQSTNEEALIGTGTGVGNYTSYVQISPAGLGYSSNSTTVHRIYHEGFKPSLGELGGIASTGGTMTGVLTLDMNSANPLILKRATQVGVNFKVGNINRYVGVGDNGELYWGPNDNHALNHRVYHAGYKPTAADIGALATTGGKINGALEISNTSSHLKFTETDASNKQWHIEGSSGNLAIVETGSSTRATFKAGGGVALSGQLDVNGHVVVSQGNILKFPSTNYATGGQIFTRDGGQYGSNMVITSGGNLIMGGGESAVACANDFGASTTENTIITADADILFASNGNTWADRRTMTYTSAGVLNVPVRVQSGGTVKVYDNSTKRGWSLSTNSTGYAELVFNKDGTEQWTTGLRAYGDSDWRIGGNKIYHEGFKPDITSLAGGKAIGLATRIAGNADLDDYKTPGVYYQDSNNNAVSGVNYPEALAGSLVVYQGAGVTQEYRVYNTPRLYRRSQYSNGAWGTWAKDYNSVDKPSLSDLGAMSAFPANITTSVDFNNYTSNGTYNLYKGSGITWTNAPSDVAYGTMLVVGEASRNGHFVTQTITTRGDAGRTYVRTRNDGAGAWSAWEVNYSSRNKPTAGEVGALPITGGTLTGILNVPTGFKVAGVDIIGTNADTLRIGEATTPARRIILRAKNYDLSIDNGGGTGHKIYHQGFKPTAAELNAYTKTEVDNLGKLRVTDVRDAARAPDYFAPNSVTPWFNNAGVPSNTWTSGINVRGWTTGYNSWQLFSDCSTANSDNKLYFRTGKGSAWNTTYEVYHSGRKPTAADVAAVSKAGDSMTGKLTVTRSGITGWPTNTVSNSGNYVNAAITSFNTGNNGLHFFGDGTTNARRMGIQAAHSDPQYTTSYGQLDLNPYGGDVRVNGQRVYHQGFKPSAADVGALPIGGGILTNQLELSVRKSAMVVKNQAAIRYADQGNIWFQNYAEGNELVWATGSDSAQTRRMVLTSDGTLGLTGGINASGNFTANNGGSFLSSGIFRTTREINPMVEWHKPGVQAYIQYIDNNNQLKIGTSNGAGSEAAPVLALSPSQVYAPGNFKTIYNSGRAWTEVGKSGVFIDNATNQVGSGSLQSAISMYTYQPNKYYCEISYGMFHGDTWQNGMQTLTSYDASANYRITWSLKNNGSLEPSHGGWRIMNEGTLVGSVYGGSSIADWCVRTFAPISDGTLKTSLGVSDDSALGKVSQMKFHKFVWKDTDATKLLTKRDVKINSIGLIAQEVEAIDPSYTKDLETYTLEGEVATSVKTLDTANLLAVALKAIQELQVEVADLKEKLNELV